MQNELAARILDFHTNNVGRVATWAKLGAEYYEGVAAYDVLLADGRLVRGTAASLTGKQMPAMFVAADAGLSGLARTEHDAISAARRKAAKAAR